MTIEDEIAAMENPSNEPVEPVEPTETVEEETQEEQEIEETDDSSTDEGEVEPTEPEEEFDYKTAYEELSTKFASLSESLNKKAEESPAPPEPPQEIDFIGDRDVYEVLNDKDAFNKLLNTLYSTVRGDLSSHGEAIIKGIPDIVKNNIVAVTAMRQAGEKFYEENPDLVPFKKVVATVFEEISSKNPDWKYEKVLKSVGSEARKRLELFSKTAKKSTTPSLPRKKGQPRQSVQKPTLDPLAAEIEAMNNTLLA